MKTNTIIQTGLLFLGSLILFTGIQVQAQTINSSPIVREQDAPIPEYWSISEKLNPALTEELEQLLEDFIHLRLSSVLSISIDSITEASARTGHIELYGNGDVTGNIDGATDISIEINNNGLRPLSILSTGTILVPVLKDEAQGKELFEKMFAIIQKAAQITN